MATHLEIFAEAYKEQKIKMEMTDKALANIQALRADTDEIILDLWNQIEALRISTTRGTL